MKPKILVIEDETRYAYILEKYFSNEGFDVSLAFDGTNGLKEFKLFEPDIIVLDTDLFAVPEASIPECKVKYTMVGGKLYEESDFRGNAD